MPLAFFGVLLLVIFGWLFQPFQGTPPAPGSATQQKYLADEQQAVLRYQITVVTYKTVPIDNRHHKQIGTKRVRIVTKEGITVPFLQALMQAASGSSAIVVQKRGTVNDYGLLQIPYAAMKATHKSPFDPHRQIFMTTAWLDSAFKATQGPHQTATLAAIFYAGMTDASAWTQSDWTTLAAQGRATAGGPAFIQAVLKGTVALGGSGGSIPTLPGSQSGAGLTPWGSLIQATSKDTGVPADWIGGEILQESSGNATAGSLAGAYGLMALEPGTMGATNAERENPQDNVYLGSEYLAQLHQATGSWRLASCAYYGGLGALQLHLDLAGLSLGQATFAQAMASGALDYVPPGNTGSIGAYALSVEQFSQAAQQTLGAS